MATVKIPATSANLGVLFDKGGVALDAFENTIQIKESEKLLIGVSGSGSEHIPRDSENLVYKAVQYYYNQIDRPMPVFSIYTENEIPIARGLGSSAACIAGGIFAANNFESQLLSEKEIVMLSAEMEGHGDNVCAAITGGISIFSGDRYSSIPTSNDIGFILFIPATTLSTEKSRGILPGNFDNKTTAKSKDLEESMIRALYDMDYEKAGSLMELDVIHQPYRKKLLPYWDDIVSDSKSAGVWGTAISGAGPSMISMCSLSNMENIVENLKFSVDKRYLLNIIGSEMNPHGIKCI